MKLYFLAFIFFSPKIQATVLATINGYTITSNELAEAIKANSTNPSIVMNDKNLRAAFLENYIDELIVAQSSEVADLKKNPEVRNRLSQVERTELVNIWLDDLFNKKVKSGALTDLAEKSIQSGEYNEYLIQQILVGDKKRALDILNKLLLNPNQFESEAASNSFAPSKVNGGRMGWLRRTSLPTEFINIVDHMKKNEIYPEVVESSFGFHILKLGDIRIETKESLIARFNTGKILKQKLLSNIKSEYIDKLRKKSKIKIDFVALANLQE